MNWIDLLIIFASIFFALEGFGRPFILEVLDLSSFLIAFVFSFSLYNHPAYFFEAQFKIPHGLSLVLGFMTVWFLSESIFYICIKLLIPKWGRLRFGFLEFFSFVPALSRGLIFIALFLVLIATFPVQPNLKKSVLDSKIGSQILKSAYSLEQPVKNVFGGVSNDSLTFLTIKPKSSEKVNLGFQTTDVSIDEVSEMQMFNLVNKERQDRGIKALTFDKNLQKIGRDHSQDMLQRGYFSHFSPEGESVADRASRAGIDFLVIGENLAYAPTLELAHKGLMNSTGHRENILSTDYKKIGIGVADGGVYGKMFTQVFSN